MASADKMMLPKSQLAVTEKEEMANDLKAFTNDALSLNKISKKRKLN